MRSIGHRSRVAASVGTVTVAWLLLTLASPAAQQPEPSETWLMRARAAQAASAPLARAARRPAPKTPAERRAAIDAFWGPGEPTAVKLQIFDRFWTYVDEKFAAFDGLPVHWAALRDRYRGEVASGVSRGRFAAIMNRLALAMRESHSIAFDVDVNVNTVPEPGVPILGAGAWTYDTVGACLTAQRDGSALVYSAMPDHPMGLRPGDRILGYDGRPWRELYRELLREELPVWPLWWGSAPSSFDHSFVMSAGTNWHLFAMMDVATREGAVVHVPTSKMPGVLWYGYCSEQLDVPGVSKPTGPFEAPVSWGIVEGTNIGYIYVWGWGVVEARDDFERALRELTDERQVDGLVIDFRFNTGGFLTHSLRGLGLLVDRAVPTTGFDVRRNPVDHFRMRKLDSPRDYRLDIDPSTGARIDGSYDGPIAVLVGPGALSAGDFSAFWMTYHPRARFFGKSTAAAFNLPTQPYTGSGTEIPLHADWFSQIAEANAHTADAPHEYLTRREFPVDEEVWLTPGDVARGRDTVVRAALRWLQRQRPR